MYDDLERLAALRDKGAITEEEYQKEKKRILDAMNTAPKEEASTPKKLWGLDEKSYCTLLQVSQFGGVIVPMAGFILPLVMWLVNKDQSEMVDRHGKAIVNWMISLFIYMAISGILTVIGIGLILLAVLGVLHIIFVIKATIEASKGRLYKYPMSLEILS